MLRSILLNVWLIVQMDIANCNLIRLVYNIVPMGPSSTLTLINVWPYVPKPPRQAIFYTVTLLITPRVNVLMILIVLWDTMLMINCRCVCRIVHKNSGSMVRTV